MSFTPQDQNQNPRPRRPLKLRGDGIAMDCTRGILVEQNGEKVAAYLPQQYCSHVDPDWRSANPGDGDEFHANTPECYQDIIEGRVLEIYNATFDRYGRQITPGFAVVEDHDGSIYEVPAELYGWHVVSREAFRQLRSRNRKN